jgi:plasmid stabilization system protein ParE
VKIVYAPEAADEFCDAIAFLHRRNPTAAKALSERISATIDRLAAGEFVGPEVTLKSGERVRTWPIPPYRIYYRLTVDMFMVVRVRHQAMRPIAR